MTYYLNYLKFNGKKSFLFDFHQNWDKLYVVKLLAQACPYRLQKLSNRNKFIRNKVKLSFG